MDFEPDADQQSILEGLDRLIAAFAPEPPKTPVFGVFAAELDKALAADGFLDIGRLEGFGPLEAALVVERLARLPLTVEAAATALVAPALGLEAGRRPIALAGGPADAPARFLTTASLLLVAEEEDVIVIEVEPGEAEPVESLFAYPYGRLRSPARLSRLPGAATAVRRRWRVGLAVEAAGAMRSALETVVEHVKSRRAFGRPLGSFQVIQHRLAMAAETVQSARWLALRAAWSDTEADAAIAAGFVQDRIPTLVYDLQQFSGAMGLTLEFPLHFWTYRLRALVGELGGSSAQARAAALATWPDVA